MNDIAIENALIDEAKKISGIKFYTANVPAKPPTTWALLTYAPGEVMQTGIGEPSLERLYGVLMVDVYSAIANGRTAAVNAAASVMETFIRGLAIPVIGASLEIIRSYRLVAENDESWYHVPVRVEFKAELNR